MLARINESGMRPKYKIHVKSNQLDRGKRIQSKHFNTRVHLKYNKILICDDQTNNDEI